MVDQRLGAQLDVTSRVACTLMGTPIHDVTLAETVAYVARWIEAGGTHQIATVNPEFLMQARQDATFRAALFRAALKAASCRACIKNSGLTVAI